MAFSMVISRAFTNTTEEAIRNVFGQLDLGVLERVDLVPYQSRDGKEWLKIFIHYASTSSNADRLRARLDDNDKRQKMDGELNVPPVKVFYDHKHFWQVYKAKTDAERQSEKAELHSEQTATFAPRIEM